MLTVVGICERNYSAYCKLKISFAFINHLFSSSFNVGDFIPTIKFNKCTEQKNSKYNWLNKTKYYINLPF